MFVALRGLGACLDLAGAHECVFLEVEFFVLNLEEPSRFPVACLILFRSFGIWFSFLSSASGTLHPKVLGPARVLAIRCSSSSLANMFRRKEGMFS